MRIGKIRILLLGACTLPLVAACTIPTGGPAAHPGDPDSPRVTITATTTATEVRDQEVTRTETTTIAQTTVTTTATRWAIGDPAAATNPNEQLFGPYPRREVCEGLAGTRCTEHDDGWYLDLRATETEAAEEENGAEESPASTEPAEPASPSESEPGRDTD